MTTGSLAENEMIEMSRFDTLRKSAVIALQIATELLRHHEDGTWLGDYEDYDETLQLVSVLAEGIKESVDP